MSDKLIRFPEAQVFPSTAAHSVVRGGMPMKVTHQHPTYANQQERQKRLKDLKRICAMKLKGLDDGPRIA